ncbi:MAG: helix-turn-helix domain-containing protein [Stackebrandtia sp.]
MATGPTVRRRSLGHRLRALRLESGMNLEKAAKEAGISQSHLSRIEHAQVGTSIPTIRSLLMTYGVIGGQSAELVDIAKGANEKSWWHSYADVINEQYATYIGLESDASELRLFEPLLIHGLLQTEEYAREIVCGGWRELDGAETDKQIEARLARQGLLKQAAPPRVWIILDESVLRRPVGGSAVQKRQMEHIVNLVEKFPRVTLQVLPQDTGAHPGQVGPFTILDFPDPLDPGVVYLETYGGNLYLDQVEDIERSRIAFEHLSSLALPADRSLQLVKKIASGL